jgi:hypothetical protein
LAAPADQQEDQQAAASGPVGLEMVVPARDEAARLPRGLAILCRKLAGLPFQAGVIVVDSGSTDRTGAIVTEWPADPVPVRLLSCPRPGKGLAVRAGLLATRAPIVGFCDADMATDLAALDVSLLLLRAGHQVIVGSRAHPDSAVAARQQAVRKLGAAVFRAAARQVVPGVGDTQCGFKLFSGPLVRAAAAPMVATGFAFDIELLARCERLGAQLVELPVNWTDVPGSTFSAWRHAGAAFWEIARIARELRRPSATAPVGRLEPWPGPLPGSAPDQAAREAFPLTGAVGAGA